MLGISFQQVQKYERGTNSISISRLLQISIALQVTAEDLISGIVPSNENLCRISNTNIEATIDHIDPKPDPQNVSTSKGIPNWPRGMNDRMAAAYIGIKVGKFRTQVARGIAPAAIDLGCDSEVWFRDHLDAWLDKMLTQVEF